MVRENTVRNRRKRDTSDEDGERQGEKIVGGRGMKWQENKKRAVNGERRRARESVTGEWRFCGRAS